MEGLCRRIRQIELMYSCLSVTAGKARLGHGACSHHSLRTREKEKGTVESLGICFYRGHAECEGIFKQLYFCFFSAATAVDFSPAHGPDLLFEVC